MNNIQTFTCQHCKETFNKLWTDEEAMKAFDCAPWNIPGDEIGIICDICFVQFKEWFENLTEEDHLRIRNDKS